MRAPNISRVRERPGCNTSGTRCLLPITGSTSLAVTPSCSVSVLTAAMGSGNPSGLRPVHGLRPETFTHPVFHLRLNPAAPSPVFLSLAMPSGEGRHPSDGFDVHRPFLQEPNSSRVDFAVSGTCSDTPYIIVFHFRNCLRVESTPILIIQYHPFTVL